ncbi:hypothetical protein CCACVL1_22699 [Corchorus capsularis]|uniref:Uncharacterized protein n=1 Tax=Corchorus capsularis TaxID=210143 RepID=A0A1R3GXC3_COCAP|nr:hypothetical protein CCACVL1_22699 [Corchorus capsularis]
MAKSIGTDRSKMDTHQGGKPAHSRLVQQQKCAIHMDSQAHTLPKQADTLSQPIPVQH